MSDNGRQLKRRWVIYLVFQLSPGCTVSWLYQEVFLCQDSVADFTKKSFASRQCHGFTLIHTLCNSFDSMSMHASHHLFAWPFSLLPFTTGGDGRSNWAQRRECCSICTIWTAVLKGCCQTQAQDTKGKLVHQTLTWQHTLIIVPSFPFSSLQKKWIICCIVSSVCVILLILLAIIIGIVVRFVT